MTISKLERQVEENSREVEKIIPGLLEKHEDEYITYNQGEFYLSKNLKDAVELGIRKFGEYTGFAAMRITTKPIILSGMVRL